jgi:alcohol dehydrogenase
MATVARELRKFLAPEFLFGVGARKLAGVHVANLGPKRVLIVTDPGVAAAGWPAEVAASLDAAGVRHVTFSAVSANPRTSEVMEGADLYLANSCDGLVAVGGGSPMDAAKGIGLVVANRRPVEAFEGVDQVDVPMPPTVCVPTTGGTGADVSQFAILSIPAQRRKFAIVSKAVVPDGALIDPETLTTMDAALTACTGMDALTHAIEAYLSTGQWPLTDLHALAAIRLVSGHLREAVADPGNLDARESIMLGSLQAGLAFSNASLGLVHAMAHSLGGRLDLPHGQCNAILLEHVIAFNFGAAPARFRDVARAMGVAVEHMPDAAVQQALVAAVRDLRVAVGIGGSLSSVGVEGSDVRELAVNAERDPCLLTNPRIPSTRDIESVYEQAL